MPYTKLGPFHDGTGPYLSAATLDHLEAGIAAGVYLAPAPTGVAATDQANLNPLIAASQTTGIPVLLQPGTYVGNFAGTSTYEQPIIRGAGRSLTIVQAATAASPVFKFLGGSGAVSGGQVESLTLAPATGGGGTAIEFAGCGGMQARDLRFRGGFAVGVQFHNDIGANFTEFCVIEGTEFQPGITLPVQYLVSNGVESFHGSGLRGQNVIETSASFSGPVISIGTTAYPYQAPLELDVFPSTGTNFVIIQNNSGSRIADYYGHIRVENQTSGLTFASGYGVWLTGSVHHLGSTGVRLGTLERVERVTYNASVTWAAKSRKTYVTPVAGAATNVTPNLSNGPYAIDASALMQVTLYGAAGYHYVYQLLVFASPYNSSGTVTTLATPLSINTAGYGAPTFGWNNGLTVTNASYPTSGANQVTAYIDMIPFGMPTDVNVLPQ